MSAVPSLLMNNGIQIPQLGFGVFLIPPEETEKAVSEALSAGYRLIDTAQGYRNEEGVGAAIASAGIQRDELFVTTKLTNSEHGYDKALRAFDESMNKLGLDVLDLFLDSLAAADVRPVCGDLAGVRTSLIRWTGVVDRGVELRNRAPGATAGRDRRDAGR